MGDAITGTERDSCSTPSGCRVCGCGLAPGTSYGLGSVSTVAGLCTAVNVGRACLCGCPERHVAVPSSPLVVVEVGASRPVHRVHAKKPPRRPHLASFLLSPSMGHRRPPSSSGTLQRQESKNGGHRRERQRRTDSGSHRDERMGRSQTPRARPLLALPSGADRLPPPPPHCQPVAVLRSCIGPLEIAHLSM